MANPDLMTGLGAALSIFLCSAGSVFGSIQAGLFALRTGDGIMSFLPIIIAGVLAIYGIIIAVLLVGQTDLAEIDGYRNFAAGLSVGSACLVSGMGMAKFLEKHMASFPTSSGSSSSSRGGGDLQQEPLLAGNDTCAAAASYRVPPASVGLLFVMVFLEAIGLYGLIVALVLQNTMVSDE